jgi:hypothetical protein
LLPLFVYVYNFLNPIDANVETFGFPSYTFEPTNLYGLMVIDEEMASFVVKEQLNHFKVKKVIE